MGEGEGLYVSEWKETAAKRRDVRRTKSPEVAETHKRAGGTKPWGLACYYMYSSRWINPPAEKRPSIWWFETEVARDQAYKMRHRNKRFSLWRVTREDVEWVSARTKEMRRA